MRLKRLLLIALLIGFSGLQVFSQTRFVERITRKGNEIIIPYEKYILKNGLTLLIHVDKSDPIVHVDVTYHVGSAREELGRSGFAHFFEHMMFQGSDHVGDEEHFRIISESGGTLNGTTTSDRTNYFETLPSNHLETALWLESDRMGFLLDAVTQQKFEIQRATVKNERGQNYDNRPYGLVNEKAFQALFPYGHSYSWPTIGYMKDLDRVNVEDLKRFFLRWYGPNNAVLTVAGDVNPPEVIKLVEKYFGSIPRGPEVSPMAKSPVIVDKDRYISYEDNIRFPLIQISFPSTYSGHKDELPLDLLAEIIGGGQTSMLYQNLVKTNIALQANAFNPCQELAGAFVIQAVPMEISIAELEKIIRETISQFEKRGVTDDDIIRFKNKREAQMIQELASVSGKAAQLASFQTFRGNPNYITKELEELRKLSKEQVVAAFNKYIKGKSAVILSVYPKGKKDIAAEDNFYPKISSDEPGVEGNEYKNLKYVKAKDNFDRNLKPPPGKNPSIRLPVYWKQNLANGIQVIGTEDKDLPMVSLLISIPAGHIAELPDKAGVAQMLASLLNKSSVKYTAEEKTRELEKLGSEISFSADREKIYVRLSALKKNIDATIAIMEESMFNPRFDSAEFKTTKSQQIASITNEQTRATSIANNAYNKLLYGNHILGVPVIGTAASVGSISLEDVKTFYRNNFTSKGASIVVVGDISQSEILSKLPAITKWNGLERQDYIPNIVSNEEKTKIYFINKENAPQSEIRIGYLALPYDADGDYYKCGIMNHVLGGTFNSRINILLREKRGFTYGARSGFSGSRIRGDFTAAAGVKAEKTDSAIVDFLEEINKFRQQGITEEELLFTRNSRGQQDALKYETPFQKASFLQRIIEYNLDSNFVEKQNTILKTISKEEINGIANRFLPTEKMIVVVVGDKAKTLDSIKKLGMEVVEYESN